MSPAKLAQNKLGARRTNYFFCSCSSVGSGVGHHQLASLCIRLPKSFTSQYNSYFIEVNIRSTCLHIICRPNLQSKDNMCTQVAEDSPSGLIFITRLQGHVSIGQEKNGVGSVSPTLPENVDRRRCTHTRVLPSTVPSFALRYRLL